MSENRLLKEKSPYLLQHANNPVDWYPWGEEAFDKSKKEDKPIFLSIGYSTCHWCHNMAKESFENEEIANLLNKNFISIKVDREERYDLDNLYMKFVQASTGKGGWPMSVFLTPEGLPFFTGTYFPRVDFRELTGFKTVLLSIIEMWKNNREKIEETAKSLLVFVENNYEKIDYRELLELDIKESINSFKDTFDSEYGGFGDKPKFPMGHNISFLIEYFEQYNDEEAIKMASYTLDSIFKGGIYDHVGGGFSRYSVDEKWIVPHFEKMLYDNALLLEAYTKAYKITKNEIYKKIVIDTIEFLKREMMDEKGGFYAGLDADSDGDEGKYYVWTESELEFILGKEDFSRFLKYFNVDKQSLLKGKIALNRVKKDISIYDYDFLEPRLEMLFKYRETRIRPTTDKKILTAWNSLLAKALFIAGDILEKEEYIELAKNILDFIGKRLIIDGRIMTSYIDGEVKYKGYIQDYSAYLDALYEGKDYFERHLNNIDADKYNMYKSLINSYSIDIEKFTRNMINLFYDSEKKGFFINGVDSEELILRTKELNDGAMPSGNSIASRVLIRKGKEDEDKEILSKGKLSINAAGGFIKRIPIYHGEALRAGLLYFKE